MNPMELTQKDKDGKEIIEDNNKVTGKRNPGKDRQYNDQKKKDKKTINEPRNTTHKIKDPTQTGVDQMCPRMSKYE